MYTKKTKLKTKQTQQQLLEKLFPLKKETIPNRYLTWRTELRGKTRNFPPEEKKERI